MAEPPLERCDDRLTDQGGQTDQERGPDQAGQGSPLEKPGRPGAQRARRDINDETGSRQEAGGHHHLSRVSLERLRKASVAVGRQPASDRSPSQDARSQSSTQQPQTQVAAEDAQVAPEQAEAPVELSLLNGDADGNAGEIFGDERAHNDCEEGGHAAGWQACCAWGAGATGHRAAGAWEITRSVEGSQPNSAAALAPAGRASGHTWVPVLLT